jgi:hypothetical protein
LKVPSGQAQKKVDEEIRQRELDLKLAEEKNVMDFRMKRRDQRFTLLGLATTAMVGIAGIAVPPITTTIQSANDRAIAEAKAAREQVRGAYAAFLDSTNKFVVAERVLVDSLDQCRIVPDIKANPNSAAVTAAYSDLQSKNSAILLTVSQVGAPAAERLLDTVTRIRSSAGEVCSQFRQPTLETTKESDKLRRFEAAYIEAPLNDFLQASRSDILLE